MGRWQEAATDTDAYIALSLLLKLNHDPQEYQKACKARLRLERETTSIMCQSAMISNFFNDVMMLKWIVSDDKGMTKIIHENRHTLVETHPEVVRYMALRIMNRYDPDNWADPRNNSA